MKRVGILLIVALCVAAEPFKNRQAESSRKKYEATIKKAEAEYFQAVASAKQQYQKDLADAQKIVMKNQDLEEAKRIDELIADLSSDSTILPRRLGKHPKDAMEFNGHWYKLVSDPITWHAAKAKCEEAGGYLVCLESIEEAEFVRNLSKTTVERVWIGVTDEDEEGKWKWVTGKECRIPMWAPGEPNNGCSGENMAALILDKDRFHKPGKWVDFSGDARWVYICEWEE